RMKSELSDDLRQVRDVLSTKPAGGRPVCCEGVPFRKPRFTPNVVHALSSADCSPWNSRKGSLSRCDSEAWMIHSRSMKTLLSINAALMFATVVMFGQQVSPMPPLQVRVDVSGNLRLGEGVASCISQRLGGLPDVVITRDNPDYVLRLIVD